MTTFGELGIFIAWSLRFPTGGESTTALVGRGHNPSVRAEVLCYFSRGVCVTVINKPLTPLQKPTVYEKAEFLFFLLETETYQSFHEGTPSRAPSAAMLRMRG